MKQGKSYKTIAKTTGLIGAVQIFQMFFGLIRNKALALIVGAEGFGIWGLYNAYVEMMSQLSILGLDQSGVRQIAKNAEDADMVSKSIFVTRSTIFAVSLIITFASITFSKFISTTIFGASHYYVGVIIVSSAIFFNGVYKGQSSILIGLGYIKELAMSQILGAISGSLIAIAVVYFCKDNGIAIYVLSVPLVASIFTGFYVNKVGVKSSIPKGYEAKKELYALFSIGIAFCATGVISTVMTYFSRIYLTNNYNLEAVGIYQASWTISNLYIGMILSAMGVDLMPRLMKVNGDQTAMNKLINEQMELGLLIASIGVVGILAFSPLLLKLLYSDDFLRGTSIIRWQVLGVSLRVLAFPFSYAIMAKGKTLIYVTIQFIFWVTEYFLLIFFSKTYGFEGLGANYLVGYILYFTMTLLVCRSLLQFRFSTLLVWIMVSAYTSIVLTFVTTLILPSVYSFPVGLFILLVQIMLVDYQLKAKMDINVLAILKSRVKGIRL